MRKNEQNIIPTEYEEYEIISDNSTSIASTVNNVTKNPGVQIAEKLIENPEAIRATGEAAGNIITSLGEAEAKVITSVGDAGGTIINAYGNSKAKILDAKGRNADGLVKLKQANGEVAAKVITSVGDAGGTIINAYGNSKAKILDAKANSEAMIINAEANSEAMILDAKGRNADGLVKLKQANGEVAKTVIDTLGDNLNPIKIKANLERERLKTDQIKAMTNPEFVRAVGKYKNIDTTLQKSYSERETALETMYQQLNSSNKEERIEAMRAVSSIVSSSALKELDKIESKYQDPSQDLLIDF